jgi:nitroimidazol reductase NimA-like FMN-containing flavoprotein (pyridoxamine 5'-phosphate oxidase superfamily)
MPEAAKDLRGSMVRAKRMMPDEEARAFLRTQKIAHLGTVDPNGWPYVVPLAYIYLGGDTLWVHTGAHQGHFLTNLESNPRVCVTVSELGGMETAGQYLCDGSQLYGSVVVFGTATIVRTDDAKKKWFFDRLRERYVPPDVSATLSPEYPDINKIIVYEIAIDIMTGKRSSGVGH